MIESTIVLTPLHYAAVPLLTEAFRAGKAS